MTPQKRDRSQPNWLLNLCIYTIIIASCLIIYGYRFPTNNNIIEVPPVMAMLDPELFQKDFYVRDTVQITPRYYYQLLIYLITSLGTPLSFTYFLIIF